ncbi:dihydroorotase [Leptospira sp. GIMC2001]|uniref:dihydroorotase n=1 Tax=Leptospira sp. GIMC2001 TaxID=1513297 RepID=UPI00234A0A33|nr:dihydroorotase [Leptospira sp. GIMC2001]WCL49185.1 dihydroorotase [Leptospira sp. GIMC2001]
MKRTLITNAQCINENKIYTADVLIEGERISKIDRNGIDPSKYPGSTVIDASGKYLLPGVIDTQVHFREPGLEYKEDLWYGSHSAVSGGTTSFMEMPNTNPQTLTQELLEKKYEAASKRSFCNYSFFMGTSNNNLEEVLKTDPTNVCGIKIFMGASTGNMLVDNPEILRSLFSKNNPDIPISLHCEDEPTIRRNIEEMKAKYGENVPIEMHPIIRSEEACYLSSSFAVSMAKEFNTRIHILHLTTEKEMALLDPNQNLREKRITAEVCVHHLWFSEKDYKTKGAYIKWNPAIKKESDRLGLWKALKEGKIDVIATDHAPHTIEEKENTYFKAPGGGPLVAHSLIAMLEFYKKGEIQLEFIVNKMCHAPAEIFRIKERGYLREGYFADLTLVDLEAEWQVSKSNINYKCGWSPFEGDSFHSKVVGTFVNGNLVYKEGVWSEPGLGKRLEFDRSK